MSFTVLYRWRLHPGSHARFQAAWSRGTTLIHRYCGSYGARLHFVGDEAWSYARWPSDAVRQGCWSHPEVAEDPCFAEMQACVAHRYDEVVLDLVDDQLDEPGVVHPPLELRTPRLHLRPLAVSDAPALHGGLSDPETMRWWSRGPHTSLEETLVAVRRNASRNDVQSVAITLRDAPEDALGWVILMDRKPGVLELGYFLRPDAQGRGLAREAVGAMVGHAFMTRGVRRVFADTDPDNVASRRLLEALGFTLEGRLRARWETHIGVCDSVIYGMLAGEWSGHAGEQS